MRTVFVTSIIVLLFAASCEKKPKPKPLPPVATALESSLQLSGNIRIDGSSTVYPIIELVAADFNKRHPNVKIDVKFSGTSGGFKRFIARETDISDASRPIQPNEIDALKKNGIGFIELPIGSDGITVVVNRANKFVDFLSVDELRRMWMPETPARLWSDIRPDWPSEAYSLCGPGGDSGTLEYFTEKICNTKKKCVIGYYPSEDDEELVSRVINDVNGLSFFGFSYYEKHRDKLKAVPIDNGNGPVSPSVKTIVSGEYSPLSRPLFIYVSDSAIRRPEIREFINLLLSDPGQFVRNAGYVPLPDESYGIVRDRFKKSVSEFNGGS